MPIIWFVVWILIGIWVYRDAESRGMNGVLWLIVLILTGIVGLIIYLVVRKEKKSAAPPPPP
jgi:membrane protein DedA with SNARE-associated domain